MEIYPELPPPKIREELELLDLALDEQIPPKKLGKNLLIATWNIRGFGNLTRKWESTQEDSPRRDFHAIQAIARIINRFDVVAVQEIKSNIRALRDTLKILGDNWSFILTDVTKGAPGNSERMGYLFDIRRVKLSGLAAELVVPKEWLDEIGEDALQKQFARTPYAVGFKAGHTTFILVTLHVLYGEKELERLPELKAIARWFKEWARDVFEWHQNLLALGDFNIEERGDLLHKTFIAEGLHIPEELEKVGRSIFDETKFYDHIAWYDRKDGMPALTMKFLSGGSFDFLPHVLKNRDLTTQQVSWLMSDHYPLWAEFEVRD